MCDAAPCSEIIGVLEGTLVSVLDAVVSPGSTFLMPVRERSTALLRQDRLLAILSHENGWISHLAHWAHHAEEIDARAKGN